MVLLHEGLTKEIIAACFQIHNELGTGYLESVYEKALLIALQERRIEAHAQVPIDVTFHGQVVGQFFADILIEDLVIIELKTVTHLLSVHKSQLINYLKATGIDVGLLVNFHGTKVEYARCYRPNN
ncbi:MAG: hypothetical protein BWY76_00764 [bacterium ADurb.Bin429]|nr:MAG: hypothetical protein BWY76_00764 [bacterium ADurb.Bin429]